MRHWLTKDTVDGVMDWLILALMLPTLGFGFFTFVQYALLDVEDYIEVSVIEVHDTLAQAVKREIAGGQIVQKLVAPGTDIQMDVGRVLHQDFSGAFRVTLREGGTGTAVCTTELRPWEYKQLQPALTADGQPKLDSAGEPIFIRTELPEDLNLTWWALGGTCTDILRSGIVPGLYTQQTCHAVKLYPWVPFKEKCWPITTFSVVVPAAAPRPGIKG